MINTSRTVYQMSRTLLCQVLRGALRDWVNSGEVGSVACRAVAALYVLLLEHPVDRWGRCAACGWAGVVFGRRRRCRIYRTAHYWLHQPDTTLVSSLDSELGLSVPPPIVRPEPDWPGLTITGRAEPDDTDVLPRIEAEVPSPSGNPAPEPPSGPVSGSSVLVTGGVLCLA